MGLLALLEFRSLIEKSVQRQNMDTNFLNQEVNDTIKELVYAIKFPEMEKSVSFNTVDGQTGYTFGSDIAVTDYRALHDIGLRKTAPADRLGKLIPETREEYLLRLGDTGISSTRGEPRYYHRYGKKTIFLRPIPDATVVTVLVHYWSLHPNLTNDGDVTLISEDWDEAIRIGASARVLRDLGDHARYQNMRNDFIQLVRTRVMDEDLEEFPEGGISLAQQEGDKETR